MSLIRNIIKEEINIIVTERQAKGQKQFVNHANDDKHNKKLNAQDEREIQHDLDSDIVNMAALARKVYPDHTPEGAQSQLRKHVKNITNDDSKATYHLRKGEAETIRKELSKLQ